MKINLKQEFKTVKGEPVTIKLESGEKENATLGEFLANIILEPHQDKKGFRPLKAWELAQKMTTNDEIEIDNSELVQIRELVDNCKSYPVFVLGQIQEYLIEK